MIKIYLTKDAKKEEQSIKTIGRVRNFKPL